MKTAKMFEHGIQYMDRPVFTWVSLITAINDTFDSFHVAWSSISERYLSLSFWHFFLSMNMELYHASQCVMMSRYKLKPYQMIDIDTGDGAGTG